MPLPRETISHMYSPAPRVAPDMAVVCGGGGDNGGAVADNAEGGDNTDAAECADTLTCARA